jgi:hypothetical protein
MGVLLGDRFSFSPLRKKVKHFDKISKWGWFIIDVGNAG